MVKRRQSPPAPRANTSAIINQGRHWINYVVVAAFAASAATCWSMRATPPIIIRSGPKCGILCVSRTPPFFWKDSLVKMSDPVGALRYELQSEMNSVHVPKQSLVRPIAILVITLALLLGVWGLYQRETISDDDDPLFQRF